MYWVKIGEVHYDLAEAWQVRDHRELTEEEKNRRPDGAGGPGPPEPSVAVFWKNGETDPFHGEEADEFMSHFEKFRGGAPGPSD
ncbi:MAG: hypothetical protein BGO49_11345 [Planctomycetales bacterium 71-10]|nr:MAG: hypothetical protein BGO49_11345 [Planctomycetales bacterium 71-10]